MMVARRPVLLASLLVLLAGAAACGGPWTVAANGWWLPALAAATLAIGLVARNMSARLWLAGGL